MGRFLFFTVLLCLLNVKGNGQTHPNKTNIIKSENKENFIARFGEGLSYTAPDSSMKINFSTRFQTLFIAQKPLSKNAAIEKEMMIRRFRVKFEGFAFTPKLDYKIELALSNQDVGPAMRQTGSAANIVLDAVLKYRLFKNSELWFGQTKLPGNRERVISSQDLQFVDRSLVNSTYNLDRDVGIQFHHKAKIGEVVLKDIYAIALGQGRNVTAADTGGLSYTGRFEILPFGEFTNKGDYFDSDFEREPKPKLSIGAGYSYNNNARRENGELGSFLKETRNLKTFFADVMLKYRGWSVTSEYMNKTSDKSPVLKDTSGFFRTGYGWNIQSGFLFKNNLELAGRFTIVNPTAIIKTFRQAEKVKEYTIGMSRYFKGHNLKMQTDVSYINDYGEISAGLRYRLQVEMGL